MSASVVHILNLLEMRFDYQSARNVYRNWRKANKVGDVDTLDDNMLKSLFLYLKDAEPDAKRVHDAIERLVLAAEPASDAIVNTPVVEEVVEAAPEDVVVASESVESAQVENTPVEEVKVEPVESVPAEDVAAEVVAAEESVAEPVVENVAVESVSENKAEAATSDAVPETGKKKRKKK